MRQNLPGLCMISWAMANCTEYLLEEMKMMPMRGMISPQVSQRVEKRKRNLRLMVQERIMARQRAILKNPSSLSNFLRSQGVGFRQSRLKTSSRMGKRAQTTAMRTKAILEYELQVEKRLIMLSRDSVQQGSELMMREFFPKRSILLLGRHCSSLAIIPPYLNLPKHEQVLNPVASNRNSSGNVGVKGGRGQEKSDHDRVAASNRQTLYSQFFLQKRQGKWTIGRASSVFSDPWRIFTMRQFQYLSNLVQIYRRFRMEKVQRPPLQDQMQSAHFPRICERFNKGPSMRNMLQEVSSPCGIEGVLPSNANFWIKTFEKRVQRSSLTSCGTWMRNLASWIHPWLCPSSQVSHRHFWQSQYPTFALVTLLSLIEQPFEKSNYPPSALIEVYMVLPLKRTMQGRGVQGWSSCGVLVRRCFSMRKDGVISTFLKRTEKRSKLTSYQGYSGHPLRDSMRERRKGSSREFQGRVLRASMEEIVVQSSGDSAERTRLKCPRTIGGTRWAWECGRGCCSGDVEGSLFMGGSGLVMGIFYWEIIHTHKILKESQNYDHRPFLKIIIDKDRPDTDWERSY